MGTLFHKSIKKTIVILSGVKNYLLNEVKNLLADLHVVD